MVFDQTEIENAILDHFGSIFQGKRVPIFPQDTAIDQVELTLLELDQILTSQPPTSGRISFRIKSAPPIHSLS